MGTLKRVAAGLAGPSAGRRGSVAAVLTLGLLAAAAAGYFLYFPSRLGPAQPIPFSHRVHVQDKQLSCLMCHPGVVETARADVPALETCMLCHDRIIVHHPAIARLRRHWQAGEPVEWVRLSALPDYVFFHHAIHVRRAIDCGQCHGPVAQMDRLWLANDFTMGFCVQCHRQEQASTDCLTCHR